MGGAIILIIRLNFFALLLDNCIFDSDSSNSKIYTTYLSQLDTVLITKNQTTTEDEPKLLVNRGASKSVENSYLNFQFHNHIVFLTVQPISVK